MTGNFDLFVPRFCCSGVFILSLSCVYRFILAADACFNLSLIPQSVQCISKAAEMRCDDSVLWEVRSQFSKSLYFN
jgi:hypothetical protein